MDKKAQGLSLNTIIIAIVVLIVLVVLIMIFTGYFGTRFTPEVTSCANAGGICKFESCGTDAFGNDLARIKGTCSNPEQICCSKGLGEGGEQVDLSNCGEEGKAQCPDDPCKSGLEPYKGTCRTPLIACAASCLATSDCKPGTAISGTVCEDDGKVCCELPATS